MEAGIIGLPLAGKTTIFNSLTGLTAATVSYSGGKKQVNLSEVAVPDERVEKLTELFHPKRKIHASVLVKDIPVQFDEQKGILPASLGEIRNADAVTVVVRAFSDKAVPHPLNTVDPARDLQKILDSLIFSDYEVVEKRMERLTREGKKGDREYHTLQKIYEKLSEGKFLGSGFLNPDEIKMLSGFRFLTVKPMIIIANTGEGGTDLSRLEEKTSSLGLNLFSISGKSEMDISQLEPVDQKEFLADMGLKEPAVNRFIKYLYKTLNHISFFTAGEDEVRAWSVERGSSIQKAAGKIHSDMEKGFIRAEVIEWKELLKMGGFSQAKKEGAVRLEGKAYTVQDGDVVVIRFNV